MKVLATHITRYWYSDPVSTCHNEVHLAPRPRANQILLDYNLTVTTAAGFGGVARGLLRQRGFFLLDS